MRPIMNRSARAAAILTVLIVLRSALAAPPAGAQEAPKYHDHAGLTRALQALAGAGKATARLESIGKSRQGRDIWALEIAGPGGVPPAKRPALLICAGFEGDHLVGSEIALAVARHLLDNAASDAEVKGRLTASTVYIIPRLNPDGAEGFFAAVKTGRRTNAAPSDDDNDGRVDEDGPEDLNGDGMITIMRVPKAGGEYMIDPDEPRLMKKADPKKGESGSYELASEGVDNDGDGFINEDPPGGVDLDRNFTHAYPYYAPDAGPHMVSEPETRALMDWVLARRNIAAILTFGGSDNLIVAPTSAGRLGPARGLDLVRFAEASVAKARAAGFVETGGGFGRGRFGRGGFSIEMLMGGGARRSQRQTAEPEAGRFRMPGRNAATTFAAADQDYLRAVSEKYIELTGIRQPLSVREPEGAFFQYGYFQFGVPSFSTPGFGLTTAESAGPRRPGAAPPGGAVAGGGGQTGRTAQTARAVAGGQDVMALMQGGGAAFRAFQGQAGGRPEAGQAAAPGIDKQILKWMDAEKIDGFVAWTKAQHPEYGEVEIGGFKPYAVSNPPASLLPGLGTSHAKFAVYLLSLFPRVKVARFEASAQGGGLFRLEAEVENAGFWPTALAHAQTAQAVKPAMVQLGVEPDTILSGSPKTNFLPTLDGSGSRADYAWLIRGKTGEVVELLVQSEKGGSATARVTLK